MGLRPIPLEKVKPMKLLMCSVRDSAANAYHRPFCVNAAAQAIRSFGDEVNRVDPNNEMNRHPEDYELYAVGEFDDETATVTGKLPTMLVRAIDLIQKRS